MLRPAVGSKALETMPEGEFLPLCVNAEKEVKNLIFADCLICLRRSGLRQATGTTEHSQRPWTETPVGFATQYVILWPLRKG